jgi:hypothetical protein
MLRPRSPVFQATARRGHWECGASLFSSIARERGANIALSSRELIGRL